MTKEQALISKYGTLMTLVHLAQELHRSPDGLRISLRSNAVWASQVNAARKKFGRRVYFDTAQIAAIIDSMN
ncbi:DNA-binding protein [Comamonas sp. Y6]|uniref:DNA-binding protein n=1 Tax=Comamonas resistens TaxID=3046670 RepID=A0ABY8SVV4_9BURK|nr:DNA-binding protein [Comamonas resistens]MDL5036300.1 DNA-binding protein [Comamonas resistens]WHS66386.1 DNA-binding protein [Comamonas resistens]